MPALGLRLDPGPSFTTQDFLELTLLAEERGYDTVWFPEDVRRDAMVHLSTLATATSRIRLGTGILPIFSRTPTLMAMSAAALDMISDHRLILGLGVSTQDLVEGSHGVTFRQPMTRLKETVEIVRQLLKGGEVSFQGKVFNVESPGLGLSQQFSVPIHIAALGPKMIELAGEVADGILMSWACPPFVKGALERGASRAGRNVENIEVGCYLRVAVTENVEAVRASLRQQIIRYAGMDYYRNLFARAGFEEEMQAIGRYLAKGDADKAVSAISDEMQRQLAIFGPAEFCREEIEKRRSLGVKNPVISPFIVGDTMASFRATIEAFSG